MNTTTLSRPPAASPTPAPEPDRGSPKRIDWVDIAKGLSVLLIVLGHAVTWVESLTGESEALHGFVTMLTPVRIPMFFFVSGLFAVGLLTGPRERIVHRVADLLKVYVLWSAIILLVGKVFFNRFPAIERLTYDTALNELVLPNLFTWFLWALAVFTIIGAIGLRHAPRITLIAALAMLVALDLTPTSLPGTHAVGGVGLYGNFLFFILPFYLPAAQKTVSALPPVGTAAATGIGYCLVLFLAPQFEGQWFHPALRIGATALGVISLLCIARMIEGQRQLSDVMTAVGRKTLPIYVTHIITGMAMTLMLESAGLFGGTLGNTFLVIAVTAMCAALGIFIERAMPQPVRDFLFVPSRRRPIV